MQITIEIAKEYSGWKGYKFLNRNFLKKIMKVVLDKFDYFSNIKNFELSILLTDDSKMLKLNEEFRGKQKSTNVLSFPSNELNWKGLLEIKTDINYMYLGDIAFGYQIIKNEAIDQNKSFQNHFIHLFVHSLLHLIGFDHVSKEDARAMESVEVDVLNGFSITKIY